ncbi:MAG: flagellar hook-associated protein FlgK [bacterium]
MIGINLSLYTALNSMRANTLGINTAAHNIANMNTEGYSKQIANMSSTVPLIDYLGSGTIGTGSKLSSIERVRNVFLDAQIRSETMEMGKWQEISTALQTLKTIFPEAIDTSLTGLESKLQAFYTSWSNLSAEYAKPLASQDIAGKKAAVYLAATQVASVLNQKADALVSMKQNFNSELNSVVNSINTYTQQIAEYNTMIKNYGSAGTANDILDKRDLAITKLSALINITAVNKIDGTVLVNVNGKVLVDEGTYNKMVTIGGTRDASLQSVGLYQSGSNTANDISGYISSGKLAGIIQARDMVQGYKNQLDNLAGVLIEDVNRFHSANASTTGLSYINFFTGTKAETIAVNADINGGANINDTRYTTGDTAAIIAQLGNKVMNNRIMSKATGLTSNSLLGFNGSLYINGIEIAYTSGQKISDLINKINATGNFSATFDDAKGGVFTIMANSMMTVSEYNMSQTLPGAIQVNQLMTAFSWVEEQFSSSAVNLSEDLVANKIIISQTWGDQSQVGLSPNKILDIMPTSSGGVLQIGYNDKTYTVNWLTSNKVSSTIVAMSSVDTAANFSWAAANFNSGAEIQKFSFGTNASSTTANKSIMPVVITDRTGNLSQVMKLTGSATFTSYTSGILNSINGAVINASSMLDSYTAGVDQVQALQDSVTAVDVNAELVQAKLFQRAYEASVKLSAVIDEMLNMLINRMATSSSSSSSTS